MRISWQFGSLYCIWIVIASSNFEVVQGQLAEHFAVGQLLSNVNLPLVQFDGFHLGVGKCLKEVPTSSLFSNRHTIPPGNGSTPFLSVVERCCDGYKRYKYDRQYCVAKCTSKCQNGFCVAPNVCVCFTDHVRSLNDECVTTCPIGCLNGKCDMNATCTCNPGYSHEPNKRFCVPMCSRGCEVNANCTAPEQCSCLRGYRLNATAVCEPICIPNCGNGICVGPNQCECKPSYMLKEGSCQANCSRGCLNGRCVESETCVCNPGYKLVGNGTICEPICSKGCMYGNCTGPEHCTCFEGYELKRGVCKPACKKGCINGECIQPETCICSAGYTLNSRKNACKPVCETGCSNGKCVAPNKCKCDSGYNNFNGICLKFDTNPSHFDNIFTKLPSPKFHPTISVHPVSTRLPPTYVPPQTTRRHIIVTTTPHWPIFDVPIIVQPSQSNPRPGNHTIAPRCNRSCLNGICSGQNICTCNKGYAMELGSWYKCTAYCPEGCPNGQCTSPNFCTCNYGFMKKQGVCIYKFA